MKKSILTAALILAASTLPAFGQNAADTSARARAAAADTAANASANTPVNTSVNTAVNNTPIDTLNKASGNPAVNNTSDNAAADTSADTLFRTTVSTFADTLITTYHNEPAETLVSVSVSAFTDTLVGAPAAGAPTDTVTGASTSAPADTAAGKPAKTGEKIFLLPPYAFHVAFFAASIALIAATLYFFMTRRRRDDSRRFLTTTRLSVLDKLVQRGCRHIESNYPDPALTPETVCNSLVTGKAYLDALFMNELGINVQDFIVQVRVNAIKNRLSADQAERQAADINEICAECGFADRAEAERCFSAICGGVGIAEFARFSKMQNQKGADRR